MNWQRVVALLLVVGGALTVSAVVRRRRPDAPTQTGYRVPMQLDRQDFSSPEAPWLVVAFTSASCSTCADVAAKAAVLASHDVAVDEVEWSRARSTHERYSIDAVPTLVVADIDGVVRAAFVGPVTAQDMWSAVAECREPGSTPGRDGCTGSSRVV